MLGAIIGDIAGSRFERNSIKSKMFKLLSHSDGCRPTDDSVMTLAIAKAILSCDGDHSALGNQAVTQMQYLGRKYPYAGYGGFFRHWLRSDDPEPYNSYGNGSAMRVSPCAFAAQSPDEAVRFSKAVTEVTHNHPEGIKGAEAVTVAVFMALHGSKKDEIREYINEHYYPMDFTLDEIRETYRFNVSCQGSVPQAIMAFLEASDFEDAIRNTISLGGDADTQAAIAGGIAEAYFGIPDDIRKKALTFLDERMTDIVTEFEAKYQ